MRWGFGLFDRRRVGLFAAIGWPQAVFRARRFLLPLGVELEDDGALAVAVLFALEPVIDRRQLHVRFDKIRSLLDDILEQTLRLDDFAERDIDRGDIIADVQL